MFNPVQIHFTADPIFATGVFDPVPVRSGFVQGVLGDEVGLIIAPPPSVKGHSPKHHRSTSFKPTPSKWAHSPKAYTTAAIRNAVAEVTGAPEGARNITLFKTAASLFKILNGDEVAITALANAALHAGLEQAEIIANLPAHYHKGGHKYD